MKVELHELKYVPISEFADQHQLIMEVHERNPEYHVAGGWCEQVRYYAHFKNAEIKGQGVLIGSFGDGATPEQAIIDYAKEISGKTLVIYEFGKPRREIMIPLLCEAFKLAITEDTGGRS